MLSVSLAHLLRRLHRRLSLPTLVSSFGFNNEMMRRMIDIALINSVE